MIKRRQFIAGIGSAAAWPLVARAQQDDRVRRIGLLMSGDENDPIYKPILSAFTQALADLGWTIGRNVRMDLRWGGGDINRLPALAREIVGQPDIIATGTSQATIALQRETRTIPIVFAGVGDPVASGIVARVDRPSGSITGFAAFEPSLGGKWLELLSDIAPSVKRVAIIANPDNTNNSLHIPVQARPYREALRVLRRVLGMQSHADRQLGSSEPGARQRDEAQALRCVTWKG
jgi:putative tryptophan/tyrosine transport system substrate-binding protein